jgi:hypothetical protein
MSYRIFLNRNFLHIKMTTLKKILYLLFLLTTGIGYGQSNLVPNGDFETFSACPEGINNIDTTINWFSANTATPDYYNSCSTVPLADVPVNWNGNGYQYPRSGEGYVGIYSTQWALDQKEFIETTLSSALILDRTYHFSMYVNLLNICRFTTHNIGVYFSDSSFHTSNIYVLPVTPQIVNPLNNTFDTLSWTLVSGDYTAHGGEQFIIIGNFDPDALTDTNFYQNSVYYGLYLYIDDVSLTENIESISDLTTIGIDIFPNPILDILNVKVNNYEENEIILYDISSRKMLQQTFTNTTTVNTEELGQGMYFYEVRNKSAILRKGKVIK